VSVVCLNRATHKCPVDITSGVKQAARWSASYTRGWHGFAKPGTRRRTVFRCVEVHVSGNNQQATRILEDFPGGAQSDRLKPMARFGAMTQGRESKISDRDTTGNLTLWKPIFSGTCMSCLAGGKLGVNRFSCWVRKRPGKPSNRDLKQQAQIRKHFQRRAL
jgi:hypothetical protein